MLVAGSVAPLALAEGAATESKAAAAAVSTAEDRFAIQDLVYRYAMALDSLDKTALADCFAAGVFSPEGVDEAIEYHLKYEHTMHNVTNHVHTVRGRSATGITYCVASMVKRGAGGLTKFDIYLLYHDELVKQADRWRFSKRKLTLAFSTEGMSVVPGAPFLNLPIPVGSFREPPALAYPKP